MNRFTILLILTILNFHLWSQYPDLKQKYNKDYSNSIGIEYDLFYKLSRKNFNLNSIVYPEYQFAISYNKYFWGKRYLSGQLDFGVGVSKTSYDFDHQNEIWLTHNYLHIPIDISVLIGERKNFFKSGMGIFYNGQRVESVQLSDIEPEYLKDYYITKNTVYINYFIGYKRIIKNKFSFDFSLISGRRDLLHFDLKYSNQRNLESCYPHYQIKIECFL